MLPANSSQHPNAAIDALLNTPAGSVPDGSYLVVFTGAGPTARKVTVPITPLDRDKTIEKLMAHLNIALNSISDIKVESKVSTQPPKPWVRLVVMRLFKRLEVSFDLYSDWLLHCVPSFCRLRDRFR